MVLGCLPIPLGCGCLLPLLGIAGLAFLTGVRLGVRRHRGPSGSDAVPA
jgi:hypothetical protein